MNKISIILPVYNERETIEKVIKEWIKELEKIKISYKLIICEDGSSDGTSELIRKIELKLNLILNQKKKRRGYGRALIDGIKTAKSQYILCVDSDGQCDPKDFKKFWDSRTQANIIIGWRTNRADSIQRKLFSFMFKIIFTFFFPIKIHDPSAPYVLFKKKTVVPYLKHLEYLKEGFWWGFVGMAVKKNLSICEITINHRLRLKGDTVIYKINKIPLIVLRNIFSLIRLRYTM